MVGVWEGRRGVSELEQGTRERKRKERRQDWWADEQRRRLRTAEGEKQNEARKSRVEWPLSRGCSIAHHRAQATAPHRMSGWRRSGGQSASEQREREGEEESLLPLFRSAAAHAVVAGGRCLRGTRSIGVPCASAAPFPSLLPTPKYGAERRDTRSIGRRDPERPTGRVGRPADSPKHNVFFSLSSLSPSNSIPLSPAFLFFLSLSFRFFFSIPLFSNAPKW